MLSEDAKLKLKKEIQNDPAQLGYAGKTPKQIADLMYKSRVIKTDILYEAPKPEPKPGDKIGEKIEELPPRISAVLAGVEGAPNKLEPEDIAEALK